MYTTVARARELSGFDDEDNISDSIIRGKIMRASALMDGAITYRYSLPLPFHRQNLLTFGGAGVGSDAMAIVVNGTTYNIAITSGMTPSQAADLFRVAANDSDDFITGVGGSGAEVILISKTNNSDEPTANAEVNVASAPTTEGITGTIGSRVDRYPQLIDQLTAEITTAYLFQDNYGAEQEDTNLDGDKRLARLNIQLQELQGTAESGIVLRITDEATKLEISQSDIFDPDSIPNDTTDSDSSAPTAPKATINQKF